uniref:Uncharacterized protein n=2 Tax=Kalanchoe fedtschenkoi TaxID=63787 RepID=A0A7N0V2B1_KALFE
MFFLFLFHPISLLPCTFPIRSLRRIHPPFSGSGPLSSERKMNCNVYQHSRKVAAREEVRTVEPLPCPKPRRLGRAWGDSIADHITPNTYYCPKQVEECSRVNVGAGLLDIIMGEGGYGDDKSGRHLASSPPFFYGSPPPRSSNPVVQDARFESEKAKAPLLSSMKSPSPVSSPSSCKSGGARLKLGQKTAVVRIEGFDCLGGHRQNCNISGLA